MGRRKNTRAEDVTEKPEDEVLVESEPESEISVDHDDDTSSVEDPMTKLKTLLKLSDEEIGTLKLASFTSTDSLIGVTLEDFVTALPNLPVGKRRQLSMVAKFVADGGDLDDIGSIKDVYNAINGTNAEAALQASNVVERTVSLTGVKLLANPLPMFDGNKANFPC